MAGKTDKVLKLNYSFALMNNAKWHSLFNILLSPELALHECRWKFVNKARIWETPLPQKIDLRDSYLAASFFASFGPLPYYEIEWLEIADVYAVQAAGCLCNPVQIGKQNIYAVFEALQQLGEFPLEKTNEGVRIRAYA